MNDISNIDKAAIEAERKLINLMLQHPEVVEEVVDRRIGMSFFTGRHQPLVQSIFYQSFLSEGKRLLSDKHYRSMLIEQGGKGDISVAMKVYHNCLYGVPPSNSKEDVDMLAKQITEAYVYRKSVDALADFNKNIKRMGYLGAAKQHIEDLNQVVSLTEMKKAVWMTVDEKKMAFLEGLKKKREDPAERLTCGIEEIDSAMNVGFKAGHTSLYISATGGNKTNLMLNIALQIHKKTDAQVLFIPLEMDWEDFVTRMVSNVAEISYTKLLSPASLTEEEIKKIEESQLWFYKNFAIMDVDERISVSAIRRELEKRANYFKPTVVVVDYLSLLKADDNSNSFRHDLALGELSKTLKFLGRKMNFHIITAAQLGRADIKRIREEGADAKLDSTAVKDSQEVSSHAEFIFALTTVPDEENRLKLHVIKSRYAPSGYTKELHLNGDLCKISGTEICNIDSGNISFGTAVDMDEQFNNPAILQPPPPKKVEFKQADYGLDDIG